jgi:hypothetical protein
VALVRSDISEELIALVFLRTVLQLRVIANIAPRPPILFTLMMEIRSSETSVLTRATRRHIPENGVLRSHRRENLKWYNGKMV